MVQFATYLQPEASATSRPIEQIRFMGHSQPYFESVRAELAKALGGYPSLPLRQADYARYGSVHTADYLDKLARMAAGETVENPPRESIENTGLEFCIPGYLYSLGGMLEAIDRMKAGTLDRAYTFAMGGHHAYPDWGHGYCLLNPLAAAARYAQAQGFEKILIVDWDIHHGDGTQAIFAHDSSVYCISIHSGLDLYMMFQRVMRDGTTTAAEAAGQCNIPLLEERYAAPEFLERIEWSGRFYQMGESIPVFRDALAQVPFSPDLICIFSGYDSHVDDCGEGITGWTNADFQTLTRAVLDIARKAGCPVLSTHGGGYKLPVTVAAAVSHVEVLASYW